MQRITERDIDTLARTLYGEAEANNADDAKAIAWVVVNRANLALWPDSVAEVCLQPWQFSCWNTNDPNRARILAARSSWFQRCREIALGVLNGEIPDPTSRSTHYYATFVKQPKWAKGKTPVHRVSHKRNHAHLFFNDIDTKPPMTAGEALSQVSPLSTSRTMAGATVVTASGAGAIAVGAAQQIADAAPAVAVVSQVAETAHNHPSGLMIAFGLVVIAAGLYIAWARRDDRQRGIR